MPKPGEIRKGKEVKKTTSPYIWHACADCGKERWVPLRRGLPKANRCHSCANKLHTPPVGAKSHAWSGGRVIDREGYVHIKLTLDDFFFPMADVKRYVREHRLVVAKTLGRCLLSWEIVHHKGAKYPLGSIKNKQDNRYPENLELIKGSGRHNSQTERQLKRQAKEIRTLQNRVTLLEADNILLGEQIKSLGRIYGK